MIGYGVLMGIVARYLLKLSTLGTVAVSALLCGLFLSMQQRNILEWGFMVSWPLVYVSAILSYVFAFDDNHKKNSLIYSFLFAFLSSISMANGALTLIPVAGVTLFTGKWRLFLFSVIGSGALLLLHFWGLKAQHTCLQSGNVIEVLKYTLAYVGGPLYLLLFYVFSTAPDPLRYGGEGIDPVLALYVGGALILGFAILTFRVLFVTKRHIQFTLVAIGGFVLVTALATSTGRFSYGLATAVDGRYGMGGVLFTVVVGMLFIDIIVSSERSAKPYVVLAMITLMFATAAHQVHMAKRDREWANLRRMPAAALLADVNDSFVMKLVYPWENAFPSLLEGVQKERLGMYSEKWADWIGKPLPLPVVDGACSGELNTSEPVANVQGALRVNGWATYPNAGIENKRIVILDRTGTVVGYGFNGWVTEKVRPALSVLGSSLDGWYGYVGPGAEQPLKPFLLINGGRQACPLPG
ncbi:hypothetical protein QLQ09_11815 [Brucella sp. NM4]|uniref:hypothetical protein n=1 Tax=Brucella sp. NM4 TaxID=3045175 RepID=UPI0024BC721D|nr:hypothetical protein [Brucella sp. NM4]WHS32571.1 hypothetical protein QLQ09_11815 [Brucella sp. NM4]